MNRRMFITGGSSGIGFATAARFAREGFDICITSLDPGELQNALEWLRKEFPACMMEGFVIDLAEEGAMEIVQESLQRIGFEPDIVVHNAGFGSWGFVSELCADREMSMIRLMVLQLYESTRYFLKRMDEKGSGTIINISSISAFQPSPTLAAYGAAKAFIYQFSRALQAELAMRKSAVRCIVICPTPVKTGFQTAAGMEKSALFQSWMTVTPAKVADSIFTAYTAKQTFVVPGRFYHFLSLVSRRLPERWQIWLAQHHLRPLH